MNSVFYKPLVYVTDNVKSYLENSLKVLDSEEQTELKEIMSTFKVNEKNYISFALLKKIHQQFDHKKSGLYLNDLMTGSHIQLPQVPVPRRNPQLEERVRRLKNRFQEEEYRKMVKNVSSNRKFNSEDSIGRQYKELNKHLITIFNFLLTVVCMFVFAFKATEYALGRPNLAIQLMAGMTSATVVFIADIYFIIKSDL